MLDYRAWDNFILRFIESQPPLLKQALKDIAYHPSVKVFCNTVLSLLKSYNRKAVIKSKEGVLGNFIPLSMTKESKGTKMKSDSAESSLKRIKRIEVADSSDDDFIDDEEVGSDDSTDESNRRSLSDLEVE